MSPEIRDLTFFIGDGCCFLLLCYGLRLFVWGWVPAFLKLKGYSSRLYAAAVACFVLSSMSGMLVRWCLAEFGDVSLMINGTFGIMVLLSGLALHFLPTLTAYVEKRSDKTPLIVINCLFLIPFSWECCWFWACSRRDVGAKIGEEIKVADVADVVQGADAAEAFSSSTAPSPVPEPQSDDRDSAGSASTGTAVNTSSNDSTPA